jgi:hypothetical protein
MFTAENSSMGPELKPPAVVAARLGLLESIGNGNGSSSAASAGSLENSRNAKAPNPLSVPVPPQSYCPSNSSRPKSETWMTLTGDEMSGQVWMAGDSARSHFNELIHPLGRLGDGSSAFLAPSRAKAPGKPQGFQGVFYHRPLRQCDPAALFNPPSRETSGPRGHLHKRFTCQTHLQIFGQNFRRDPIPPQNGCPGVSLSTSSSLQGALPARFKPYSRSYGYRRCAPVSTQMSVRLPGCP